MNITIDTDTDLKAYEEKHQETIAFLNSVFLIPTANTAALQARIDKINRRAKKCHLSPVTLNPLALENRKDENGTITVCYVMQIVGDLPKINGYSFKSKIEHLYDMTTGQYENIVRPIPGMVQEGELKDYRHADPICQHCNTMRKRLDTFVLENNGTYIQVGRNCLADFLGGVSWHQIEELTEILIDVADACKEAEEQDEWDDWGHKSSRMVDIKQYLSWCALSTRTYGWVSRGKARDDFSLTATADNAIHMMDYYMRNKTICTQVPTQADQDKVELALSWVRALPQTEIDASDYLYNLNTICKQNYVRYQHTGIAGSLIFAYDKAMDQIAQKKVGKTSNFFGTIDEKVVVTVKVTKISYSSGKFGTTSIYQLLDESNGNQFTWFTTSKAIVLKEDEIYTLEGKVLRHDDSWRGIKKTVLGNCKFPKAAKNKKK